MFALLYNDVFQYFSMIFFLLIAIIGHKGEDRPRGVLGPKSIFIFYFLRTVFTSENPFATLSALLYKNPTCLYLLIVTKLILALFELLTVFVLFIY